MVLSKERSTLAVCAGTIAKFGLNCGPESHIQGRARARSFIVSPRLVSILADRGRVTPRFRLKERPCLLAIFQTFPITEFICQTFPIIESYSSGPCGLNFVECVEASSVASKSFFLCLIRCPTQLLLSAPNTYNPPAIMVRSSPKG